MSSHNEQVQPAAFDIAAPTPANASPAQGKEAPAKRPTWVVPALLGLGALAVIVVFWLPGRIDPAAPEAAAVPDPTTPTVQSSPARTTEQTAEEASPWSDAQYAKLRKEAQDMLGELLEVQELLEQAGVELWAPEAFEQAKVFATQGDTQYRERQFVEAIASYEQSLTGMNAILESEPDALEKHLELAREAIEAGERDAAESALDVVAAIEPKNEELAALRARAATLEQLLTLLESALEAESTGDLAGAETLLREANALDPEHRKTLSELERITAAHTAMRFNDAMTDGYTALDESQYSAARAAFNMAAGLMPGSDEAASALQEVQVAQTASRLATLQGHGKTAEDGEQWQEAANAYEQALKIDANILYAQEGLKRSSTRAKLDQQFNTAIDEPERLSDSAVAEAAAVLLRLASTISPRGPILDQQISELESLLKQANTVRPLTLRSDGETEVILYKVARLGQFQQHQLNLRPGKYTAVGTRSGYRDVRVTFDLQYDGPLPSVVISCTEQI